MTTAQILWLIACSVVLLYVIGDWAGTLSKKLLDLERQNDRQLEILNALLEQHGLDPVTLD